MAFGFAINLYLAVLWLVANSSFCRVAGMARCGARVLALGPPLLLFGVLLMLLGFQTLTTGLLGEMVTFKNFKRRDDSYSIRERLGVAPSWARTSSSSPRPIRASTATPRVRSSASWRGAGAWRRPGERADAPRSAGSRDRLGRRRRRGAQLPLRSRALELLGYSRSLDADETMKGARRASRRSMPPAPGGHGAPRALARLRYDLAARPLGGAQRVW